MTCDERPDTKLRWLLRDPYTPPFDESWMRFRLTYAGPLVGAQKGKTRADHKQAIREYLSPQLERLWAQTQFLRDDWVETKPGTVETRERVPLADWLADNFEVGGIGFVPLVTARKLLHCSLHILFLRPGRSGSVIQGGDIDNRLKTLFDALRRPQEKQELAGATAESTGGRLYCLLEDDKLIDNVAVETGDLLESVGDGFSANDVRLVITVDVLPFRALMSNLDFIGV